MIPDESCIKITTLLKNLQAVGSSDPAVSILFLVIIAIIRQNHPVFIPVNIWQNTKDTKAIDFGRFREDTLYNGADHHLTKGCSSE